jgi:prepilin signal peptidase PulO-like enzyme (type II secretory pathway)
MRLQCAYAGNCGDNLSAALIGAIAGYLVARHISEIEWVLHMFIP